MCCLPTLFQVGIALFLYKWVRECRCACKVDALANFPIAFFISAMSSFTLLTLDLISLLLKPDRSKSSVRFSFSVETLWGGLRVWRNTSPEAFPADRVLLSIFRSRRSLPYNISNFSNCRVRFFNIQEGGEVSPWLQPNVIPAKAGISLRLPRAPTAGLRRRPATPRLIKDDDVTNKKGIYPYILTGDERNLSIRAFTDNQKIKAYERQLGICPICKQHFELVQMEADHITPWCEGGPTIDTNCQMLCRDCDRRKSDK